MFDYLPHNGILPVTETYFLRPENDWLAWDATQNMFRGRVPHGIAAEVGAERFEAYTMPLELMAHISKRFPGSMRFERVIRCVLPVTVRRRPTSCSVPRERLSSPAIPRPTTSTLLRRPPLVRSPLRRSFAPPRPPPATPRTRDISRGRGKENDQLSTEEVAKLLSRKAEEPKISRSPIRLNPLSLARLHDALSSSQHAFPNSGFADFEVRALHELRSGIGSSYNNQQDPNRTPSRATVLRESPSGVNLGSTHVDRRGKLASRSDSGKENEGSAAVSIRTPPTREITPPASNVRASARRGGKRPLRDTDSPTKSVKSIKSSTLPSSLERRNSARTCSSCAVYGRVPRIVLRDGMETCLTCEESSIHRWIENVHDGPSSTLR